MGLKNRERLYIFGGLIGILMVYSVYVVNVVDVGNYYQIPRLIRQLSRVAAIFSVYIIGIVALRHFCKRWVLVLWHAFFFIGVLLLLLIGVFMYFNATASYKFVNLAYTITEFLTSPLFYVACIFLNYRLRGLLKSGR